MRKTLPAALLAAVLVLAGCSAGGGNPPGEDTLVYAYNFAPRANFALETDDAGILTRAGSAETLTKAAPDGTLQPYLATEWTRADPLTWEFTLRDDVTFHDGTPLNGEAVVTAINSLLASETPPRSFTPELFTSIEATGEFTVQMKTPTPNAILPYQFVGPNTAILAPSAYEGDTVDPVGTGTGPYVITRLSKEALQLEANDAYWGGAPKIEQAEMRFILDGNVRATMVESGEAQIVSALPVSATSGLEGSPDVQVEPITAPRTFSLYLNNALAPLDDVRVRQAIQSAIDVEQIVAQVMEGYGEPGIGPFGPDEPWAPSDAAPVPRDVDKAQRLLADAGIQPGELTLRLWAYNGVPELSVLATVIQAQLSEIGVNTEIRVAEYGTLEPEALAGQYDMFLVLRTHLQEALDPLGFLESDYSCEGGFNVSQFCDPELDTTLAQAKEIDDQAARYAEYQLIAQQLQEQAVTVFLVHAQDITAINGRLKGFKGDPFDTYVLTNQLSFE